MNRLAEGLGWLVYAACAVAVILLPDRMVDPFLDGVAGLGRGVGGGKR